MGLLSIIVCSWWGMAMTLWMENTGLSGIHGEMIGERMVISDWPGMTPLSVALTIPPLMAQPVMMDLGSMDSSMYVASVVSCLTVPGPWVPMSSPCHRLLLLYSPPSIISHSVNKT